MTERDLMSLVYIQAQIEKISARLAELEDEDGLGAINMDGMPHSRTPGNPVERMALARAALHEKLLDMKADRIEKEAKIREYINSVDDAEVGLIMEMRYLDCMNWFSIASVWEEMTGKCADRTTLSKKVKKYLREHQN